MTAEQKTISALVKTLFGGAPFSVASEGEHASLIKAWGMGVLRKYFFYKRCVDFLTKKSSSVETKTYLMICFFRLDESKAPEKLANKLVANAVHANVSKSLVNAVLRRYLLEKEKLEEKFRGDMSAYFNMSSGLLRKIKEDHPNWRELLEVLRRQPKVCICINTKKTTLQLYAKLLQDKDIQFTPLKRGFAILTAIKIQELPGYDEGYFWVQSEANQIMGDILPQGNNSKILDACAAPGGKTALLSTLFGKKSTIMATDVDKERVERLDENIMRLQLDVDVHIHDWEQQGMLEKFDLIWVDAPCSSTGVIAKHPEVAIQERDVLKNVEKQKSILANAWASLNEGGTLVYTTCSLIRAENEGIIQTLLDKKEALEVKVLPKSSINSDVGAYIEGKSSNDFLFIAILMRNKS